MCWFTSDGQSFRTTDIATDDRVPVMSRSVSYGWGMGSGSAWVRRPFIHGSQADGSSPSSTVVRMTVLDRNSRPRYAMFCISTGAAGG